MARAGQTKRPDTVAVLTLSDRGGEIAGRLAGFFPGLEVMGYKGGLKERVAEAFGKFDALVFICATGIAVRMISPLIKGKELDPAVLVIDEAGRFVVSLISGHLGGANALAREMALKLGAVPVITTATDSMGLPCVEDLSDRFDLVFEDVKKIKTINSGILDAESVGPVLVVDGNNRRLAALKAEFGGTGVFTFRRGLPTGAGAGSVVLITSSTGVRLPRWARGKTLVARPREFVLGVGCRRGVSMAEVRRACEATLKEAGISPLSIRNLATIDIKRDETGLTGYAEKAGYGMEFYTAEELNLIKPPSGTSRRVRIATGAGGVSEPAALLSSRSERIWRRKRIWGNITVAVAKVPFRS